MLLGLRAYFSEFRKGEDYLQSECNWVFSNKEGKLETKSKVLDEVEIELEHLIRLVEVKAELLLRTQKSIFSKNIEAYGIQNRTAIAMAESESTKYKFLVKKLNTALVKLDCKLIVKATRF